MTCGIRTGRGRRLEMLLGLLLRLHGEPAGRARVRRAASRDREVPVRRLVREPRLRGEARRVVLLRVAVRRAGGLLLLRRGRRRLLLLLARL